MTPSDSQPSAVTESEATRVALAISRDRNSELLADLLTDHDIVEIGESVPEGSDLCIVDDRSLTRRGETLTEWKESQRTTYAPVLLLSEIENGNPWAQYADVLGEQVDAIQPIPAPKSAILARIESLQKTRRFSEEIKKEQRLIDRTFETSPVGIAVLDTDGTIVQANKRAETIFGLSKSAASGQTYESPDWQRFDEDGESIPKEELPFATVMDSGRPVHGYEYGVARPDGETIWLSVNMSPLDDDGEIEYLVSTIADVTEEKQLQRDLLQAEELQRTVLSNILDTVLITDDDGRVTYVCANVNYIFGYSAEEVREMGTLDALLGADPVPQEFGDGDVVKNIDWEVTDADGNKHDVLVTVKSVSIQDGTRLYSVRDITELIEAEEELEREQARFKGFVEGSSDIITVVDKNGDFEYVSPSVERILGYEQDDMLGESVFGLIHPDDIDEAFEMFDKLVEGTDGEIVTGQYRIRHADGSWRWTQSNASTHSNQTLDGIIINTRDISTLKSRERQLRRTERAIEASGHAVYITDSDVNIEYVNPAFERITGYDSEEILGENPRLLKSGEMSDGYYTKMWKEVTSGEIWEGEVINQRKGGGKYHAAQTVAPILDENDSIEGFVAIQTDITDHKERLQQLQVLDRVLRHNLRNEMNVIRGYAETIAVDAPKSPYAEKIVDACDRLMDLVETERTVTGILSDEPQRDAVEVVSLLERMTESLATEFPEADIDCRLPDEATTTASTHLEKALSEVLRNAIVHSDRDPPEVTVTVTERAEDVELRIADTGPGIPEMDKQVVTGDRSIEPLYHGSGLGLWLVSLIVRRSNGTLAFDDNDPRGTVVSITLRK